jgi:hypothetical protein
LETFLTFYLSQFFQQFILQKVIFAREKVILKMLHSKLFLSGYHFNATITSLYMSL